MHESLAPESPASEPLALDFHHRCIRHTERVSVASDGAQGNGPSTLPSITADGRFVAFESGATNLVPGDTNGEDDIFVHDRATGVAGDRTSEAEAISASGRYVAFWSMATNLVPNDTNVLGDIFVHDLQTGETTRVSVSSTGAPQNGEPVRTLCEL